METSTKTDNEIQHYDRLTCRLFGHVIFITVVNNYKKKNKQNDGNDDDVMMTMMMM